MDFLFIRAEPLPTPSFLCKRVLFSFVLWTANGFAVGCVSYIAILCYSWVNRFFFASKITVQFAYKANNVLGSGKQIEFVASRSALEEMLNVVVPMERKWWWREPWNFMKERTTEMINISINRIDWSLKIYATVKSKNHNTVWWVFSVSRYTYLHIHITTITKSGESKETYWWHIFWMLHEVLKYLFLVDCER